MTEKIKTTAIAVVELLSRPFTQMWAFILSVITVVITLKFGLNGKVLELKYIIPELLTIAFLLSFFKGKWRTAMEWFLILLLGAPSMTEVYLTHHFKLELSCQSVQLLMETNKREASEFIGSYIFKADTLKYAGALFGGWTIAALIYLLRAKGTLQPIHKALHEHPKYTFIGKVAVIITIGGIYFVRTGWLAMQPRFWHSMASNSVAEFEKRFFEGEESGGCGVCTPLSRIIHGARLYYLTTKQCEELVTVAKTAKIDGCDYKASNVVLMIGESFIKRHAQIYGYDKPTTPRMLEEMRKGNLVAIDDAVTAYTLTSNVFKEMLSMHSIGEEGTWASEPLFPQLFKLANYRVSLISNQYTRFNNDIWNSTGSFFLTNPKVSDFLVDYHNERNYRYDEGLLQELDAQLKKQTERNLIIFHVRGQHVSFEYGYPESRRHFTVKDYASRKGLNAEQKQAVADYDNCTRYQDSITGALFDRLNGKDVVMVMVSDHGENVYDDGKTLGRVHNDYSHAMLESEYQVPMWIWCSDKYKTLHPDMVQKIKKASKRPFETDDIPHLMLELAGIRCKYFTPTRSLINDKFNVKRARLIGNQKLSYDKLLHKK